jgi:2-dehydro-3-deoxygalactonokinase
MTPLSSTPEKDAPPGALLLGDWGGTHLRAWVLDAAGAVLRKREFDCGVNQMARGEAPARFAEARRDLDAEALPALICGAIGSNVGWVTAPYVDCPADVASVAKALARAPGDGPPVWIVPGVRSPGITPAPDVLRGEETQAFGWVAEDPSRARGRRLICHPGTHPKWMRLEDGRLTRFVSAFTGEVFDLFNRQSILRTPPPYRDDPAAFEAGVAAAGDGDGLLSRLYAARGRVAGADADPATTPSFLSGLLIAAECATAPGFIGAWPDETIEVIGSQVLRERYAAVLAGRGWRVRTHDDEAAALAGLRLIHRLGGEG